MGRMGLAVSSRFSGLRKQMNPRHGKVILHPKFRGLALWANRCARPNSARWIHVTLGVPESRPHSVLAKIATAQVLYEVHKE